jgi:hypothetical protein
MPSQVRDYERLGLNLSPDIRRKVEFLKTTIGELCIEFQQKYERGEPAALFY